MCSDDQTYIIAEPPEDLSDDIISWGMDNIDDQLLFEDENSREVFGRESFIHLSLLPNIEAGNKRELHETISMARRCACSLGMTRCFTQNAKFDVVYVEVLGHGIRLMHDYLSRSVIHERLFPVYIPHITVAYVNKGCGEKFARNRYFYGKSFRIEELVVSYDLGKTREKVKLAL